VTSKCSQHLNLYTDVTSKLTTGLEPSSVRPGTVSEFEASRIGEIVNSPSSSVWIVGSATLKSP